MNIGRDIVVFLVCLAVYKGVVWLITPPPKKKEANEQCKINK